MQSNATTVKDYISELPADRREAIETVRNVILKNLPEGYEEIMQYGMISYVVPHSIYPAGYHVDPKQALPYISLASQKNHMAIYFMNLYGDGKSEEWFVKAYTDTGKKLDMGKSCVRFKKLENLPLEVIGEAVALTPVKKYLEQYENVLAEVKARKKK
jgi:uncharacterized protein YdhG (YjbR/CyaY superfamily)